MGKREIRKKQPQNKKTSKSKKNIKGKSINTNRQLNSRSSKPNLIEKIFYKNLPLTVQESIKYEKMYPDGICKIDTKSYSKTIKFEDINYAVAKEEDQAKIFSDYSMFLKLF